MSKRKEQFQGFHIGSNTHKECTNSANFSGDTCVVVSDRKCLLFGNDVKISRDFDQVLGTKLIGPVEDLVSFQEKESTSTRYTEQNYHICSEFILEGNF